MFVKIVIVYDLQGIKLKTGGLAYFCLLYILLLLKIMQKIVTIWVSIQIMLPGRDCGSFLWKNIGPW